MDRLATKEGVTVHGINYRDESSDAAAWLARLGAPMQRAATLSLPAHAVLPDEILDDPVLEARARELSLELRCLVCQNQSIDDSGAELARDLRVLVRERLVAGDSNEAALEHIRLRYGDFVLLRPPVQSSTYLLSCARRCRTLWTWLKLE